MWTLTLFDLNLSLYTIFLEHLNPRFGQEHGKKLYCAHHPQIPVADRSEAPGYVLKVSPPVEDFEHVALIENW